MGLGSTSLSELEGIWALGTIWSRRTCCRFHWGILPLLVENSTVALGYAKSVYRDVCGPQLYSLQRIPVYGVSSLLCSGSRSGSASL